MDNSIYLNALNDKFQHYLKALEEELQEYNQEENLWITSESIANSGGNLAIHLLGNLNHFLGHILGGTDYVRDRPLEFSIKNKPRAAIIEEIEVCRAMIAEVLPSISHATLNSPYPLKFGDETWTTHAWLIQLMTHLAYHTGQINYHRRILDN